MTYVDPLEVACPVCDAPAHAPCPLTAGGHWIGGVHVERTQLARDCDPLEARDHAAVEGSGLSESELLQGYGGAP